MKLAFSLTVLFLITVPIMAILIKKYDPPIWVCFLVGFVISILVTELGNKIWDYLTK